MNVIDKTVIHQIIEEAQKPADTDYSVPAFQKAFLFSGVERQGENRAVFSTDFPCSEGDGLRGIFPVFCISERR